MLTSLERLQSILRSMGPVAVAVSGGVDSMTLGVICHRTCPGSQLFHAVSAAVPVQATERVKRYAIQEGWALRLFDAGETADPLYLENPVNRCYFCKSHLYEAIAARTGLPMVSGTNLDDLGDYRPGLQAARERLVRHPWVEAGIGKAELRSIAAELGLSDLQDLPAAPCLASRVTTGISIDLGVLPLVNRVENHLRERLDPALGVDAIRCRIRPQQVVLEIDAGVALDVDSAPWRELRASVARIFTEAGYATDASRIQIEPYRRGSAFLIEARHLD